MLYCGEQLAAMLLQGLLLGDELTLLTELTVYYEHGQGQRSDSLLCSYSIITPV
jgi:hypothetical protein